MTWTEAIRIGAGRETARKRRVTTPVWRVVVFVIAIALWWLVAALALLPETLVPNPLAVFTTWVKLLGAPEFWQAVGATLSGALVGFAIAVVIGIPIGVLVGSFRRADWSTRFLIDFGRAFPAVALVGVLVLIFGRGVEMKATLVIIAVLFPMIIQTQHGVAHVSPMIRETCAAFRIPPRLFVWKVLLPSAAPSILTGLRLAASVSVLVAIAAEVLTNAPGIGQKIAEAQLGTNAPRAFAFILTAGLLGYAINAGVGWIQKLVIRWRPAGGEE